MGPSGGGKSSLAASALRAEGSGVVLMAPGGDEVASYTEFLDRDGYKIEGFDDPEFMPLMGLKTTEGLKNAMQWANALRTKTKEAAEAGLPLPYKMLVIDRIDGFGQLSVNVMMKTCNITEAPAAQSPEGARYYTGLSNLLHQLMRPIRACKGYGMDVIIISHVVEKEVKKTSHAEVVGGVAEVPNIPGTAFREALPGICDLVMYAGVARKGELVNGRNNPTNPRHYLQWLPDPDRPTKSRLGPLSPDKLIPNEWAILKPLMLAAKAARDEARNV